MELTNDMVDYKKIFDNFSPLVFDRFRHIILSNRMHYVDYDRNPLAGKLMNIIGSKKVLDTIDSVRLSWLIEGLFPEETRRITWLSKFCWILRPILKNLNPPVNDPHFKGYCDLVCDELIPELDKEVQNPIDHQRCLDLVVEIYKISACLLYSSTKGRKVDLDIYPVVLYGMASKIREITKQNDSMYSKNELKYFRFLCDLVGVIIDQEDGN